MGEILINKRYKSGLRWFHRRFHGLLPLVLPGNAPLIFPKRTNRRRPTKKKDEAHCGVYSTNVHRSKINCTLLKQLIMDKIRERIGLDRQRNLIIKRSVEELLCLTVVMWINPDGKTFVSVRTANEANVNNSKQTTAKWFLIPRTVNCQRTSEGLSCCQDHHD